jgi:hypothetical protein
VDSSNRNILRRSTQRPEGLKPNFQCPSHVFRKTRSGVYLEPILKEAWSQGYPETAICVQRFDDSLSSAIRITYRISLRSSSLWEPRYPSLTVVLSFVLLLPFDKKITFSQFFVMVVKLFQYTSSTHKRPYQ